ncbi:MAG: arginine repressor [Pseudobdellovibrionaceae bacterium]
MESKDELRIDSQSRVLVLRQLIREGTASTQEDLSKALRLKRFNVTQSTISRDLRRIGAIKTTTPEGQTIYKLPETPQALMPSSGRNSLGGHLIDIQSNENLIILHTSPGSASLVARHLDNMRSTLGILGTVAGDDTIFIAPASVKKISSLIRKIKEEI